MLSGVSYTRMSRPAKVARNEVILNLRKEGKSFREIARIFNIDVKRVWSICTNPDTSLGKGKRGGVDVIHT